MTTKPTKAPAAMTDEELEAANQALMRDRSAVLAAQRELVAEMDRRAKRRRVEVLEAAMDAERGPRMDPATTPTSVTPGPVASSSTVSAPGHPKG